MGAPSRTVEGGINLVESTANATTKTVDNDNATTYSSLIQQYLAVFLYENATFLAERLLASQKTNHAYYLLALCHYRSGKPQRSRDVLEEARSPSQEMLYLLAKCCISLEDYPKAEEALLQNVRSTFRPTNNDHTKQTVDEWILSTTVRTVSECSEYI